MPTIMGRWWRIPLFNGVWLIEQYTHHLTSRRSHAVSAIDFLHPLTQTYPEKADPMNAKKKTPGGSLPTNHDPQHVIPNN
ncbi:hypothetical protein VTJ04DRAFT_10639 [Mycothermus thermophilus]|uniref:uncharacterized protein n=1 Tax=Humicola insolens TaxID=85995 RepID=UPI00374304B4